MIGGFYGAITTKDSAEFKSVLIKSIGVILLSSISFIILYSFIYYSTYNNNIIWLKCKFWIALYHLLLIFLLGNGERIFAKEYMKNILDVKYFINYWLSPNPWTIRISLFSLFYFLLYYFIIYYWYYYYDYFF